MGILFLQNNKSLINCILILYYICLVLYYSSGGSSISELHLSVSILHSYPYINAPRQQFRYRIAFSLDAVIRDVYTTPLL